MAAQCKRASHVMWLAKRASHVMWLARLLYYFVSWQARECPVTVTRRLLTVTALRVRPVRGVSHRMGRKSRGYDRHRTAAATARFTVRPASLAIIPASAMMGHPRRPESVPLLLWFNEAKLPAIGQDVGGLGGRRRPGPGLGPGRPCQVDTESESPGPGRRACQ